MSQPTLLILAAVRPPRCREAFLGEGVEAFDAIGRWCGARKGFWVALAGTPHARARTENLEFGESDSSKPLLLCRGFPLDGGRFQHD